MHALVERSLALQYKIELAVDGLVEGVPGKLSTAEKLEAVRNRRKAWRSGDFALKHVVNVEDGMAHVFNGTHFAWIDLESNLHIFQIPFRYRAVPEKSSAIPLRDVDMSNVRDMLISFDSDLLVLVSLSEYAPLILSRRQADPLVQRRRSVGCSPPQPFQRRTTPKGTENNFPYWRGRRRQ